MGKQLGMFLPAGKEILFPVKKEPVSVEVGI